VWADEIISGPLLARAHPRRAQLTTPLGGWRSAHLGDENHCWRTTRARSRGGNCRPRWGGEAQIIVATQMCTANIYASSQPK
jgi:Nitrate reductase alpha subunit